MLNPDIDESIKKYSENIAEDTVKAIQGKPDDISAHRQALLDLKFSICQEAASLTDSLAGDALVWEFANDLPDFETAALYKTCSSLLSLSAAVFLGWLLGGFLATILGFLGLGGEIWRPLAILASLWLEDYLGANPKARRILLTVMGLGALARFAGALAAGMVRLSGLGGIRQLVFGAGPRPNIFKSLWLWFGAFFLYVFFAKKITGLDILAFRHNLAVQIEQRLKLICLVFEEIKARDEEAARLQGSLDGKGQALETRNNRELARAAISLLDSLDENKRQYLRNVLRRTGYEVLDNDEDYLIWDNATLADKYNTLGLARDGDKCRILERPHNEGGELKKGLVQRVSA